MQEVTAATAVGLYFSHKKLAQKSFEDGLIAGAEIGRNAVVNIIKTADPNSRVISGFRNLGISITKCKW